MNLSKDELAFRDEVRAFLATELTEEIRLGGHRTSGIFSDYEVGIPWQRVLAKRGWAAPHWPVEWGGCGWTPKQHDIFASEMAAADAPKVSPLGLVMAAPVLVAFGTQAQKERWLPDIRNGVSYWCQGYSEPGSGSDLASLQCRARREGNEWVINGSKIWTTHAHRATHMFCLVRTDNSGKPQQGISFLMFALNNPRIQIRPIISISGDHEFNQVFFDDARVPADALIGEENQGWTIAKFLLEHERGGSSAPFLRGRLARLYASLRESFAQGAADSEHDDIALTLANAQCRIDALHAWEQQVLTARISGGPQPCWMPAAPSMGKVLATELKQHLTELGLSIAGPYGATSLTVEEASDHVLPVPEASVFATRAYLNDRAASIYGGTNEVQRNLIARHILSADVVEPVLPTDETQTMLLDSLQGWLQNTLSFDQRAQMIATPEAIAPLWRGLAHELGLLGAALPENLGGMGGGLPEQMLICQALGAALVPEPYSSSAVLGANLLQALDDPAAEALLQGLANGQVRLAVAAFEPEGRSDLSRVSTHLHTKGGQRCVSGRKTLVRSAPWATHRLVSARDEAGQLRICVIERAASGVQRRDVQLIDGAWAAELAFDQVPVQAVLGQGDALAALSQAWDTATLVAGAEAVGVMQALMRDTLSYTSQRKQFGQPLATFQALQHRMADMYLALVQAAAAVGACADVWGDSAARRAQRVSSAHVTVLRAARLVGQGAVQLHGGMGMTNELAVGHAFKRLTVIEQQFGGVTQHLRRLAGLVGAV
ncbi:CaiA Acyl-CoA dehydrogenases [Burkholderiaceae bacterium]